MEDQTSFDLSGAIQKWRRNLAQSAAFDSNDLDELEAHLRDAIPALQAAGAVFPGVFNLFFIGPRDPQAAMESNRQITRLIARNQEFSPSRSEP